MGEMNGNMALFTGKVLGLLMREQREMFETFDFFEPVVDADGHYTGSIRCHRGDGGTWRIDFVEEDGNG
jgi:hypothetical protein